VRTTRRRTLAAAFGASALLLAVSACSSDDPTGESLPAPADTESTVDATDVSDEPSATTATPSPTDAVDATATTTPATDPAVVVPEALQFTAPLVGGGTFDGAAVAGKPTVFWFWAPT
jgi:hypothetical protein